MRNPIRIIILVLILGFSFFFTILCGSRGFFAADQSIVFDGGYRVLSGQIPYKDFLIPFGPITFWLQGIFFKIFGVNYTAYLIHSGLFNLLFVLITFFLLNTMIEDNKYAVYLGTFLSAILFYPQFGTPWFEQTSFFFSLLSLFFLMISIRGNTNLAYLAGFTQSLSILSKQNSGILFLILLLILGLRKQILFKLITGFLIGIFGFLIWTVIFSDIENFYHAFYKVPSKLGPQRLGYLFKPARIRWILFGSGVMITALAISIIAILKRFSLLIIGLIAFMYLFVFITDNQPQNSLPFLGIIAALSLVRIGKDGILRIVQIGLVILTILLGARSALNRDVQDVFKGASFSETVRIPGLEILRWGRPTSIWGHNVRKADLEGLYKFLRSEGRPFFIFPDFTIFYGLLNAEPPQPLVFFDKGLTYPRRYSSGIDRLVTNSLINNHVEIIVIERISYFGTRSRLKDFPMMLNYIRDDFTRIKNIGIFEIYQKRGM